MKTKSKNRRVLKVEGFCNEDGSGEYPITFERNSLSELTLDVPAVASRTGGRTKLPFKFQPTANGWILRSPLHADSMTFDITLTKGRYNYSDDRPFGLDVQWDADFDFERSIRRSHKKLLSRKKAEATYAPAARF